jgi:predicted nucleic acid-binding protein
VLVVDTSAVIGALVGRPPDRRLVDRLSIDGDLCAPYLLDVEFLNALGRLVDGRQLGEDRAGDARGDFAALAVTRYEHTLVADRVWELRQGLTDYDATFVALAELLDVPLVTCDTPLADAPGNRAVIELYEGAGG